MTRETNKQEWKEMRGKIQKKFEKLSSPQIDALEGHMDKLTSTVKKVYSYDQTKAENECREFNQMAKKQN